MGSSKQTSKPQQQNNNSSSSNSSLSPLPLNSSDSDKHNNSKLSSASKLALHSNLSSNSDKPHSSSPTAPTPTSSGSREPISSNTKPSSSGARRPRAGTLPSSFNNKPLGTTPIGLPNPLQSVSRPEVLRQLNLLNPGAALLSTRSIPSHHLTLASNPLGSISMPGSAGSTPLGSDLDLRLSLEKTRARAGTVALPPSSASSYFGRGVFSTNFVPRTTKLNEELRSIKSDESNNTGDMDLKTEAGHVRTLDYLGLDGDSPVSPTLPNPPQSAFASSGFYPQHLLTSYLQPSQAGSGIHSDLSSVLAQRMRASTISGITPANLHLRSQAGIVRNSAFQSDESGYSLPQSGHNSPGIEENYNLPLYSASSLGGQHQMGRLGRPMRSAESMQAEALEQSIMGGYSGFLAPNSNVLLHGNRPRASTLGGPALLAGAGSPSSAALSAAAATAAARNRAGTLAGLSKHPGFINSLSGESNDFGSGSSYNLVDNFGNWISGGRPLTPDLGLSSLIQQPSRSIWVGNLDPSTSAQELMAVFSVYGAIESLRLIPEKECAFINFVSVHDAVHAKDDVINRLEGHINLKNGLTFVRIGFGSIESAPQTPATLMGTPTSALRTPVSASGGMSQAMMLLSLNNMPGPNGVTSASQINNIYPNPNGYTTVAGIIIGPNGDPVLQSSPTRALWISSIPLQTTPSNLMDIFSPYGAIESARVLTQKNCGFVNFEHLDDAVRARKALNGREIFGSEVPAVKIGYAKVPVKAPGMYTPSSQLEGLGSESLAQQQLAYEALARMRGASAVPLDQQVFGGNIQDYRSNLALSLLPNGIGTLNGLPLPNNPVNLASMVGFSTSGIGDASATSEGDLNTPVTKSALMPSVTEMQLLMKELCYSNGSKELPEEHEEEDDQAVSEFRPPVTYYTSVPPPINQLDPHRRLVSSASDPTRLREIRKRIDSNSLDQEEMDQLATELMDEIVYLSSDYIGNTIVQKFFEKCSTTVRSVMLDRCAPHLAVFGCHKNGTWAAQKILDTCTSEEEMRIICQNLRPFGPPLLLDSLGNYVMQCCLRFGRPYNDFVFDSIVDRCWEVSQGRFGARSVRTCLESKNTTRLQIKRVAIAIILNSIPLATNPNGSLLLNWLLESSGLPGRFKLMASRLSPHLSHICTHKLAASTVLKIINQDIDPDASKTMIDGLFNSSGSVLHEILADQVQGVIVLNKILNSTYIDPEDQKMIAGKIREAIIFLRVQQIPAYKKLAEEVGLAVSSMGVSGGERGSISGEGNMSGSEETPTRSNSSPGTSKNWNSGFSSANGSGGATDKAPWSINSQAPPGSRGKLNGGKNRQGSSSGASGEGVKG
ncbi:hypothetical protein PPACK8108_LOCUS24898 [Phakopsora pachyrhizi]|uniref:Uncharacterized protein n=1 Tax=Phakopsora pachyrhizi TaxID=170000 RepID=A0AAV0BRN3_PHAPC|nr:hypothetical protein PPACK8108_LOCUS24898 [Phakopsora pachyrhizi]